MSKAHARKLAEYFHVPASLLIYALEKTGHGVSTDGRLPVTLHMAAVISALAGQWPRRARPVRYSSWRPGSGYTTFRLQERKPICRRHPRDEGLGFVEGRPEAQHDGVRVQRLAGHQRPPFGGRIMGVAADFGDQPLRVKPATFHGGPDHEPSGRMVS